MEQCIMNTDGLNALVSQLGCEFDGTFVVTDETPDALDEIQKLVLSENNYFCSTRRQLALSNVIEKSLVPLILHVCEDDDEDEEDEDDSLLTEDEKRSIYSRAVRLLMSLTLPLECLTVTTWRHGAHHQIPQKIQDDIYKLFTSAKNAFLHFRLCNAILSTCKKLTEPLQEGQQLDVDACQALNYTILLLRNILFLPETERRRNEPDAHIYILRLLFKSGLSDVLLDLLASEQHQHWCVSLVQLISLLYKDQRYKANEFVYDDSTAGGHTVSGATVCTEGSFWWCSNDTCSDVTATEKDEACSGLSNDSSSTVKESESPDESKDGSNNSSQDSTGNGIRPPQNSEDSAEHPYETVTSEAVQAMSERLLNLERSVNSKLVYWQVNEDLSSFTEALLHRGFSNLVMSLKTLLLRNESQGLSTLYFTWITAHFLRLGRQTKAPFSVLKMFLSLDIVGYLTYLGVASAEEIIVNHTRNLDVKHASRSNHLVVRALYEVLLLARYLDHKKLSPEERQLLRRLIRDLLHLRDLRQLFQLFIRHLSPPIVSMQHLADVIGTNHQYLVVAEHMLSWENYLPPFDMLEHVKSFATVEIMSQYGKLLERYEENNHEVNDSVLTMMHHIAGDCDKHEVLLQFPIIEKMARICDYSSLSVEYQDLIHFLMQRFVTLANSDPVQCTQYLFCRGMEIESMDESDMPEEWKEEETDELFQLYTGYAGSDGVLDYILEGLQEKNIVKAKQEVVVQMYKLGLLSQEELESVSGHKQDKGTSMETDRTHSDQPMKIKVTGSISDSIERLRMQNLGEHLNWVQEILLELCFIKLGGRSIRRCEIAEDPVPLYYALQGKSIPFVAYTDDQEKFIRNEDFVHLLELTGFHQAEDSGKFFPRIPHFWTPEDLLFKAQQLGPVDIGKQKFSLEDVEANANWWTSNVAPLVSDTTTMTNNSKMDEYEKHSGDLWHVFVRQCNISPHLKNLKNRLQHE